MCYYINIIRKQKEGKMGISRDKMIELVEDGMVDAKDMAVSYTHLTLPTNREV